MTDDDFDARVRSTLARVAATERQDDPTTGPPRPRLLEEALGELRQMAELLTAAQRRLRSQGERLDAAGVERNPHLQAPVATADPQAEVERIRAEDRQKDEFLAIFAHELRNPLAPIRNAVQILFLKAANEPVTRQAAEIIDRQAVKLDRLVEELLDMSRITRGKLILNREPVGVADAAARAVESIAPVAHERAVRVAVDPPGEPVVAVADPRRLHQVLVSLLGGAVRSTPKGGVVGVSVSREADRVAVHVRDSGAGLAANVLPHLFDLCVRADETPDAYRGGLGLGMHLAKKLVELHGGTLEARSDGPGHGTEVVVSLPAPPA